MVSLVHFILVLLLCEFSITHGRFLLYDSDDSETNKENGKHFADIKKTLEKIFSEVNAKAELKDGTDTPLLKTTSHFQEESKCPDGWLRFKQSCYHFDSKKLDYPTAEKECNKWDAHLVRLETKEENDFLRAFMVNHFKNDTFYWIGMTDIEKEGLWKISGTNKIVSFTDWKDGEPNNHGGNEDCVVFESYHSFRWADLGCSYTSRAICEKRMQLF